MAEQNLPGEYENPYKFNAKELDTETDLYYYGARYYNPRLSVWYGVDPLAIWNPVMETEFYGDGQHNGGVYFWGNLNPYIYTYQNPIRYIDPNGKQVDVVTLDSRMYLGEVGHAFISIGSGNKRTVYTYGRWNNTYENSIGLHTPFNNGDGVMIRLKGRDADNEINRYIEKGANVFRLSNINEDKTKEFFEKEFNKSNKLITTDENKYKNDPRAHIIDKYDLLENNCTTKTLEGVEAGNNGKPINYNKKGVTRGGFFTVPEGTGGVYSPSQLETKLSEATKDRNSGVKNVTRKFKKE
ncbi:RHS repeat-associated core domain-containing protein [Chryseobacterium lacus]|uniref:RHS repeat-associated core domain-containing protein n=1 Tax=Chryseobacterium lacus TaxID=2058346 RepID=UPI000F895125|nr:RHS repeat-associated core domain-containing protein [Chryseobacterium lacus]RST27432.1 RHS repeat-associated core domain-containing protein [Chryseobacterium lacus]